MRSMLMFGLIAALQTAPAASVQTAASPVDAFARLCLSGDPTASATTILAAADASGWHHAADDESAASDQRVGIGLDGAMTLRVDDVTSAGEIRETCGITLGRAAPGLIPAIQAQLGFPPAFEAGGSATFLAQHDSGGWHDAEHAAAVPPPGPTVSVMVIGATSDQPALVALHVLSADG